jgi:hypothetical protein
LPLSPFLVENCVIEMRGVMCTYIGLGFIDIAFNYLRRSVVGILFLIVMMYNQLRANGNRGGLSLELFVATSHKGKCARLLSQVAQIGCSNIRMAIFVAPNCQLSNSIRARCRGRVRLLT